MKPCDDTWRRWVWHLLGCGPDCGQPECTCTCHANECERND